MLYTIGIQSKPLRTFLKLLRLHEINCVIDVRSFPNINSTLDYIDTNLKQKLKDKNIYYMIFKKEFSKLREEDDVYKKVTYYDNTEVTYLDYKLVWTKPSFLEGINRIKDGINKEYNICFMSMEKSPLATHRTYMISEYLHKLGYKIVHIMDEDIIIDHDTIEYRIEDNFYHEKKNFYKYLDKQKEGANLFSNDLETDPLIIKWKEFFSSYTKDKGFLLKNIQIALKDKENIL